MKNSEPLDIYIIAGEKDQRLLQGEVFHHLGYLQ